jgi:hypothetical protein
MPVKTGIQVTASVIPLENGIQVKGHGAGAVFAWIPASAG